MADLHHLSSAPTAAFAAAHAWLIVHVLTSVVADLHKLLFVQ